MLRRPRKRPLRERFWQKCELAEIRLARFLLYLSFKILDGNFLGGREVGGILLFDWVGEFIFMFLLFIKIID